MTKLNSKSLLTQSPNKNRRIEELDYLRGMMAFSIMIYHYMRWVYEPGFCNANTYLGRIGIYGVSIFYILSGITLYHIYVKRLNSRLETTNFYIRRFFRIYPLMWVTILYTILHQQHLPTSKTLFLNFTGLFGVLNPLGYIADITWSIGNELCFYIFFPLLVWLITKWDYSFLLLIIFLFCVQIYFCYYLLPPYIGLPINNWWYIYINPLIQIYFFVSGMLIGHSRIYLQIQSTIIKYLFYGAILVFILYTTGNETILLVTGGNRIVFSFLSIIFCCYFCEKRFEIHMVLKRFLSDIGIISYSIYLNHIMVYDIIHWINKRYIDASLLFVAMFSILCTLIFSYITYYFYELPFIKIGQRIAKSNTIY